MSVGVDTMVITRLCEALQDHKGVSPYARIDVMAGLSVELCNGYLVVIEDAGEGAELRTAISWSELPSSQQHIIQAGVGLWASGADQIAVCRLAGGSFGIGDA